MILKQYTPGLSTPILIIEPRLFSLSVFFPGSCRYPPLRLAKISATFLSSVWLFPEPGVELWLLAELDDPTAVTGSVKFCFAEGANEVDVRA